MQQRHYRKKKKSKNGSNLIVRPSLRWLSSALYIRFGGDGQIQRRPEAWRHSPSTSLYMCGGTGGVGEGVSRDTVQARQWSQRRCYTGEVLAVQIVVEE
jgi:hypothetical protein